MDKKNIAAFFDIDGTIYRDSLMIEHFKKLLKYELVDEKVWHNQLKDKYANWQKRRGNYDDYMIDLAQLYVQSMIGLHRDQMEFVTNQVIKLQGDKVYMATRHKIDWHLKQGHLVYFISGAPEYLVQKMAEKFKIHGFVGTQYIIADNGTFSGEIIQMWDHKSKQRALFDIVDNESIDLASSYAYGDTYGDISMFQHVGYPVAINPTKELFNAIKNDDSLRRKTQIIVERKDMIYMLDADVTTMR